MARRADHTPEDSVLVLIDDEPVGSFGEWLALVTTDGATGADAEAAEALRDMREHGES